jgi:hypothetical protein
MLQWYRGCINVGRQVYPLRIVSHAAVINHLRTFTGGILQQARLEQVHSRIVGIDDAEIILSKYRDTVKHITSRITNAEPQNQRPLYQQQVGLTTLDNPLIPNTRRRRVNGKG